MLTGLAQILRYITHKSTLNTSERTSTNISFYNVDDCDLRRMPWNIFISVKLFYRSRMVVFIESGVRECMLMMKTWEEMLSTWSWFIFVSVGGFGRLEERNLGAPNSFFERLTTHFMGTSFFFYKQNKLMKQNRDAWFVFYLDHFCCTWESVG